MKPGGGIGSGGFFEKPKMPPMGLFRGIKSWIEHLGS